MLNNIYKIKHDTIGRKRLLEWMSANNVTGYRFAKLVEGFSNNVYPWIKGQTRPHRIYAKVIEKVTKGYVKAASWRTSVKPSDQSQYSEKTTHTEETNDHGFNS